MLVPMELWRQGSSIISRNTGHPCLGGVLFKGEKILYSRKISMSLILSLGSNLGDRANYLMQTRKELGGIFQEKKASRIYQSKAVDYLQQPPFLNQVIEYQGPSMRPDEILKTILAMEKKFGRVRNIDKGPRTLDIDIIFFGQHKISSKQLQIPHPRWADRPFIYWPLHELPSFQTFKDLFFHRNIEVARDITPYMEQCGG